MVVYILMLLSQKFEDVKIALANQPESVLTLDFVTQRLLDAEPLLFDSKKEKVYTNTIRFKLYLCHQFAKSSFGKFAIQKGMLQNIVQRHPSAIHVEEVSM